MMDVSVDDVISRIDRDELVQFTLEICTIDSPVGHEMAVAERLEDWFEREGFSHAFKRALTIENLHQAACVYARTALTICG